MKPKVLLAFFLAPLMSCDSTIAALRVWLNGGPLDTARTGLR
jgi:hypothetical protein